MDHTLESYKKGPKNSDKDQKVLKWYTEVTQRLSGSRWQEIRMARLKTVVGSVLRKHSALTLNFH